MADRLPLPSSGSLLGQVLSALRLRQAVEEHIPQRTLNRFLCGGPNVKPDTRREVIAATIEALFESDLLHSWGLPQEDETAWKASLAQSLDREFVAWDQAIGSLQTAGPALSSVPFAALPWVRLFSLEAAIRVAAYSCAQRLAPLSVATAEALISGQLFLRVVTVYRSLGNITRAEIATGSNVAESTVDEWLAGRSLPQSESILNLAALLASRVPSLSEAETRFHLRVAVAASELVRWLWDICPEPTHATEFGPARAASFVIEFTTATSMLRRVIDDIVKRPGDHGSALWELVFVGSRALNAKTLLTILLRAARDSYLRADIEGLLSERWTERVLLLYRQFPKPENREYERMLLASQGLPDIPEEDMASLEEVLAWGAVSPNPFGWYSPSFPPRARPEETEAIIRISSEASPHHPAIIAKHAMEAEVQGDPVTAVNHYALLVQRFPTNEMYRFWLGCSLAAAGSVDEAIVECRIACKMKPDWSLPATEVAIILANAGRLADALESLKGTVEKFGVDGHIVHVYGRILLGLTHFDDAIPWFRKVLDENDAHPEALACLAHCLLSTGSRPEGRKYAKLAFHAGIRCVLEDLQAGIYD